MSAELTARQAEGALAAVGLKGAPVRSVEALTGGVSNLTFRVEPSDGRAVVVRIQPAYGIFEPYDVIREARVLTALRSTAVPVPAVLGTEADVETLGAPFFVMEYVDAPHMGAIPRNAAVTDSYVRAVAAIHDVDWRAAGLNFLSPAVPGTEPAARDLAAVNARARRYGHDADPFIAELGEWLGRHHPSTAELVLCQGDINVFNYLFRGEDVVAVVDWEQAQIADRQSDLGLLSALSYLLGAQGPPQRLPIMMEYGERTGASLSSLGYYVLAGLHKLAVIHRIWSELGDSPPWYAWDQITTSTRMMRDQIDG